MRHSMFQRAPRLFLVVVSVFSIGLLSLSAPAIAGIPDPGQSSVLFPSEAVLCTDPFVVPVIVQDGASLPVNGAFVQVVTQVQSGYVDPGQPVYDATTDPSGFALVNCFQGILGEGTVVLEVYADGILLDVSNPYVVAQACVSLASSAPTEMCVGEPLVYTVDVQNCGIAEEDIDVSCTVNGRPAIPLGPTYFTNVPPGGSVQVQVLLDCDAPGTLMIECLAEANLTGQPACIAQDMVLFSVYCLEACVDLLLEGATGCVGEQVDVSVTAVNCGMGPAEIILECFVDGVPQAPITFPSVSSGESVFALIPVLCNDVGQIQVDCQATATLLNNPDCVAFDGTTSFVECHQACVAVSAPDLSACVGDTVNVPFTILNCGSEPQDVIVSAFVNGNPEPVFYGSLQPGEQALFPVSVPCSAPGTIDVLCQVDVEVVGLPGCMDSDAAQSTVTCMGDAPVITSIQDVPNDQGRRVRLQWQASCSDYSTPIVSILDYTIWRRVDPIPAMALASRREMTVPRALPPGTWDYVATVPALGEQNYSTVVETLCDSTVANGNCLSTFVVVGMTSDPQVSFVSQEASGYSLDNLAPAAPGGLMLLSSAVLAWDESEEGDFNYFTVYGADTATPGPSAVILGHTVDPTFNVGSAPHVYYHVTATDFAGNEGPWSTVLSTVAVPDPGAAPGVFNLYQSRPNPFRSTTLISFDLPEEDNVRLQIFDVNGRLVKTVLDQALAPSRYTVSWSGVDESGARVAPGIYLYRLQSRTQVATRKVILVR